MIKLYLLRISACALLAATLCLPAALLRAQEQPTSLSSPAASRPSPLHVLMLSGGPDRRHNQVGIESNVRYVYKLLPHGAQTRILFADGNAGSRDVQYLDGRGRTRYRTANVPRIDGPIELSAIDAEFRRLAAETPADARVLIYVTGHGSPGPAGKNQLLDNNDYDLQNNGTLSVRELAREIATLPREAPVTVVMVQCFSGSFGNLLFTGGDPSGPLVDRDICGFFASIPERPAAGCSPAVNEADYHDFTGYFYAALSGVDRLGHPVTGADYNHDGHVGMDEAYAYALIHDDSDDTPVCTSDVFLRRFVNPPMRDVTRTSYADLHSWAAPAQQAALDALSAQLGLATDDRFAKEYDAFRHTDMANTDDEHDIRVLRFVRLAKSVVLAHDLSLSSDQTTKQRYAQLVAAEGRNCLTP